VFSSASGTRFHKAELRTLIWDIKQPQCNCAKVLLHRYD
jgi:hypothetical protein